MKINCAHTRLVPLDQLKPNPKNPNKHPEQQIEMLAKIIEYQGQRAAIVVSKRSGFITKGHGRLMAIQKLGWPHAAVDFQDYSDDAQEYADIVADNKIAELAEHDDEKFLKEWSDSDQLKALDDALFGTKDDLASLSKMADEPPKEKKTAKQKVLMECPECGHLFDKKTGESVDVTDSTK